MYGELVKFFFPVLSEQTGVDNPITGIKVAELNYSTAGELFISWQLIIETGNGEQTYNVVTPSTENMTDYLSPEGEIGDGVVIVSGVLAKEKGPIATIESKLEESDITRVSLTDTQVSKLEEILKKGKGQTLAFKRL
ncbi:MAG: hypothetical protein II217_04785 [Alistipes sp.]|nr:hypothetical protein [Alistipes sp.]MBQ5889961.1 hypothetical protein [Clostridia bacterium]